MGKSQKQSCEKMTLHTKNTYCMISFIRCLKQVKIICDRNQNSVCLWWDEVIREIPTWFLHTHIYIVYLVLYILCSLFGVSVTKVYTFVKM